jgi:hypothetical protein
VDEILKRKLIRKIVILLKEHIREKLQEISLEKDAFGMPQKHRQKSKNIHMASHQTKSLYAGKESTG